MAARYASTVWSVLSKAMNLEGVGASETTLFATRFMQGALAGLLVAQGLSLLLFHRDIPSFREPAHAQASVAFLEIAPIVLAGTIVAWRLRSRPAPAGRPRPGIPMRAGLAAMVVSVAVLEVVVIMIKASVKITYPPGPVYLALPVVVHGAIGLCFAAAALAKVRQLE